MNSLLRSPINQPKLTVSHPDDPYEREADRVADQVMRMSYSRPSIQRSAHQISRQCQACEKEQGVDAVSRTVQRVASHPTWQPDAAPDSVDQAVGSPGTPLEPTLREEMEQRFGYNFSRVRVHTGTVAQQSARDVSAHAYTVGHNMVFGVGQYAPGTDHGRRLIAHELTHVVQQSTANAIRVGQSDLARGRSSSSSLIQEGRSAPSPIGVSCITPDRSIQRDDEGKAPKKTGEQAGEKTAKTALEETKKSTLAELAEIESNWKDLRDPVAGLSELGDWLSRGDTVIRLLRTHTELALDARDKGDSALANFMTPIVESDVVMYRFVAWHIAIFANLLTLEPQMKDLEDAFAADNRAFTGRAKAEEQVKLLRQLAAAYRKAAPKQLELVKFVPAEVTRTSGSKITLSVTIAAHPDKSVSKLFIMETDKFIQDQVALETVVAATNQFLETAFKEGLVQAAEAVVEFYTIRGGKRGGPKAQKPKAKGKKQQSKKNTKKQKCSQALIATLNAAMHALCDKPRSCSMQIDTCATATAKVAVGQACVRARTELQQKCFAPGDPGYETHMQQIAEANAALQNCLKVLSAKCK